MRDFRNKMREKMALLRMDEGFASRYVNDGFSGGEKKRLEMLQMAVLEPEMAILDETDSGLDIDALRIVAEGVNAMLSPELGVLLDHPLPAPAQLHHPGLRPRPGPGPDHHVGRQGPRAAPRGRGLRAGPARGGLRAGPARRGAQDPAGPDRRRSRARGGRPLAGARSDDDRLAAPRRPRPAGAAGRLPDPRAGDQRPPAGLSRLRLEQPEAGRRHRRGRGLLPRVQRQRPPRHLHDRREGDGRLRGRARQGRRLHQRPRPPRDHLHEERDRGHQPRRLLVGPPEHRARRRHRPDRDGAPRQPRPVADPRPGEGRRPRVHPDHRRRRPPARRLRGAAAAAPEARRLHPRLEHAGHDQPGPRDGRDGPRRRRPRPHRRCPGRAARAGRCPGARCRLLCVQRPQDARPDGLGRAVGPARAPRIDAAVPRPAGR